MPVSYFDRSKKLTTKSLCFTFSKRLMWPHSDVRWPCFSLNLKLKEICCYQQLFTNYALWNITTMKKEFLLSFEQISHIVLVFPLLTLNKYMPVSYFDRSKKLTTKSLCFTFSKRLMWPHSDVRWPCFSLNLKLKEICCYQQLFTNYALWNITTMKKEFLLSSEESTK